MHSKGRGPCPIRYERRCREGLSPVAVISQSQSGPSNELLGSELFFRRADHDPAHIMAAVRTNLVRRHGSAALWAIFQPQRLDRIMSPAATAAGIGTFSFGDGHGTSPGLDNFLAHLGEASFAASNPEGNTRYSNGKRTILSEACPECQAVESSIEHPCGRDSRQFARLGPEGQPVAHGSRSSMKYYGRFPSSVWLIGLNPAGCGLQMEWASGVSFVSWAEEGRSRCYYPLVLTLRAQCLGVRCESGGRASLMRRMMIVARDVFRRWRISTPLDEPRGVSALAIQPFLITLRAVRSSAPHGARLIKRSPRIFCSSRLKRAVRLGIYSPRKRHAAGE